MTQPECTHPRSAFIIGADPDHEPGHDEPIVKCPDCGHTWTTGEWWSTLVSLASRSVVAG